MGYRLKGDALAAFADKTALASASTALSYAELALRAASLWRALRRLFVHLPGLPVAMVSSGRAHDEAVALAGILTSGAVAVPLDAHAPPYRLASIIAARKCQALILDEKAIPLANLIELELQKIGETQPPHLFILDPSGQVLDIQKRHENAQNRPLPAQPGTLACILHTSGSTGSPKAIPITWDGLDAFTTWAIATFSIQSNDKILRTAELIFDLAWFDHLCAFRTGATLLTLSRRELTTGTAFRDALIALAPTIIYGVPSLFMKLNASMAPGQALEAQPRAILFAGEVFPPRELLAFSKRVPKAELFNLYGPTETNVCTYYRIDPPNSAPNILDGQSEIPIGKACPYAHCELRAEDNPQQLIEGEGVGELWVSGPSTVNGGPHPTRDRVERRKDGLFYFRGRIDQMIKIRGYRVEPAEIEAVLDSHPDIQKAAVMAVDDPKLGKTLRAAVETQRQRPKIQSDVQTKDMLSERAIRMFIAERLPAYMVPDRILTLEELPRTSTGKIDYQALSSLLA